MTTEVKVARAMDASKQNEIFNLGKLDALENYTLAAVSWLCSTQNINRSRLIVLRSVLSLVLSSLTKFKIWFLVGNSAWQPDTRIVRHRGIWKALKARGVEVSHSSDTLEQALDSDLGVKFFGAKLISELSAESVVQTISEERCSYILVLPHDVMIDEMLRIGWEINGGFDVGLLNAIAEKNGLILKAVGEFDDTEAGFVGVAKPELVKVLVQ